MAKAIKLQVPKPTVNTNAAADEFETKVFAKSDSPKTVKDTIKLVLNLFINFFS